MSAFVRFSSLLLGFVYICDCWRGHAQLVDVWMEDAIDKANGRRLVGVLVWYLDVNLPIAAVERCCLNSHQRMSVTLLKCGDALSVGPLNRT